MRRFNKPDIVMETALALYRAGELQAALQHLREQLQERPGDAKVRTFLFELLCFAGEWTRAEKQLDVLAAASPLAASGASLLRGLLNVHRKREQMFEEHSVPVGSSGSSQGFRINGAFCDLCADEDDRIGSGLEIYSAGGYQVLAWSEIRHLAMAAPVTLRDLLWIPAQLLRMNERDAERVFLPALAPGSWRHAENAVRLGRWSVLERTEKGEAVPFGAKLLLCGAEATPLLEVREIEVIP